MATRTISVLLAAVMLTGCASRWERTAATPPDANFDQDKARCYLMSRGMPQAGYMYAGGGTGRAGAYAAAGAGIAAAGAALAVAIQQQEDRDACMTLSGWAKVQSK